MKLRPSIAIATGAVSAATRRPPSDFRRRSRPSGCRSAASSPRRSPRGRTSEVKTVCSATMKRMPRVPVRKATT